ncbi:hypothetical protein NQ318_013306 [Aromia moschata]|uniref:Uncharacterized protein n=1 Tax=Aromia moschata TaxID=1265417 RepID=A0AAV8Y035_9CUCU|nr:hypothetical protein NQ318_013306 [Aromia moschata]
MYSINNKFVSSGTNTFQRCRYQVAKRYMTIYYLPTVRSDLLKLFKSALKNTRLWLGIDECSRLPSGTSALL